MQGILQKIWSAISHNRATVLALLATVLIAGPILSGCILTPKALSPITGQKVSEEVFVADSNTAVLGVQALYDTAEREETRVQAAIGAGVASIEEQKAKREAIWNVLTSSLTALASAAPPPVGAIVAAILGIGSIALNVGQTVDKRRADKLIVKLKNGT